MVWMGGHPDGLKVKTWLDDQAHGVEVNGSDSTQSPATSGVPLVYRGTCPVQHLYQ